MNMQELYGAAINIMNSIKASGGNYAVYDSMSVCVILSDTNNIYTGINSATIENGKLKSTCSEYNAITSMMLAKETKINKIISVSFKTNGVVTPCEECQKLILDVNPENRLCSVGISKSEGVTLESLKSAIKSQAEAVQANVQPEAKQQALAQANVQPEAKQPEAVQANIQAEVKQPEALQANVQPEAKQQETAQANVQAEVKQQETAQANVQAEVKQQETAQANVQAEAKQQETAQANMQAEAKQQESTQVASVQQEQTQPTVQTPQAVQEVVQPSNLQSAYSQQSYAYNNMYQSSTLNGSTQSKQLKSVNQTEIVSDENKTPQNTDNSGIKNVGNTVQYQTNRAEVDFVSSVSADESNPFYEAPKESSEQTPPPTQQDGSPNFESYTNETPKPRALYSMPSQQSYNANTTSVNSNQQAVQQTAYQNAAYGVNNSYMTQSVQGQQYANPYNPYGNVQSVQQTNYAYTQPQTNPYVQSQTDNSYYAQQNNTVNNQNTANYYNQSVDNNSYAQQNMGQSYYQSAYGQVNQPQATDYQAQYASQATDSMSYQAPYPQQSAEQSMVFQAPYGSTPQNNYYTQSANSNTGMVGGSVYNSIQSPLSMGTGMIKSNTGDSDGSSIYKQRLNELLGDSSSSVVPPISNDSNKEKTDTDELDNSRKDLIKSAQEKKRLAKIDAKFAKKVKRKGF